MTHKQMAPPRSAARDPLKEAMPADEPRRIGGSLEFGHPSPGDFS
jgi:hypothetical protein